MAKKKFPGNTRIYYEKGLWEFQLFFQYARNIGEHENLHYFPDQMPITLSHGKTPGLARRVFT